MYYLINVKFTRELKRDCYYGIIIQFTSHLKTAVDFHLSYEILLVFMRKNLFFVLFLLLLFSKPSCSLQVTNEYKTNYFKLNDIFYHTNNLVWQHLVEMLDDHVPMYVVTLDLIHSFMSFSCCFSTFYASHY